MKVLLALIPFPLMVLLWRRYAGGWRNVFLAAAMLWAGWAVCQTEALGAFNAITPGPVLAGWLALSVLVLAATPLVWRLPAAENPRPPRLAAMVWMLIAPMAAIAAVLLLVAWIGPPNNWDSMTYHMARVVHWMQDRNVAFFPCCVTRQVEMSPGAEYLILNLQVLSGGDHWANLVQWFCYVGSVIGVSSVAGLLGATARGQAFAALVLATTPIACLEAVTTQNDLVSSFWIICFVALALRLCRRDQFTLATQALLFGLCGLGLGLAMLTKSTTYLFAAPFCLGLAAVVLWRRRWRGLAGLAMLALVAVSINVPTFVRNQQFTHTILGHGGFGTDVSPYRNVRIGVGPTVSNILRNAAMELVMPWKPLPATVERVVRSVHRRLGIDPDDPRTTWDSHFDLTPVWNEEDRAPNPVQCILLITAALTLMLNWARSRTISAVGWYALAVAAGFLFFCAYLRWQLWHNRLHLPLLALSSAVVGVVMERHWKQPVSLVLAALLPLLVIPWIVTNQNHPLIGNHSIFAMNRQARYFLGSRKLEAPTRRIVDLAARHHCRQVAYIGNGNTWEYPLEIMLRDRMGDIPVQAYPGVTTWPSDILHTGNRGFDENLKPCLLVNLTGERPIVVRIIDESP